MLSGKLNHRIELQSKVATRDSYGSETIVWKKESIVWGSVEPISGREYFLAKQVQAETTHRIRIRYYAGLRPDWRILFGTRIFEIDSVINIEEKNREMVLMCHEQIT
jgi:SPP1 family predicted phage head-tail adaptor